MNDGASDRQQIVERIKDSSTILVTVSRDPSVDTLAAALGLTLMLGKLKKHATSVVSGAIPPAITFLDPQKTFENTVDSLRDFIIALDKEKADHLRYKVDGDVVKIFITPYRTTISQDDLDFSQGDYNVELVLALDVSSKDQLDSALESHGRILHDATVASISSGDTKSKLGSLNWQDASASSVSEMLVSLSEALKQDEPLLDEQIATAFLTGIVAATDRFSNNKTSSKVMTMAAQLMAAGANQQLIAAKLEEAHEITTTDSPKNSADSDDSSDGDDGTTEMTEDTSNKIDKESSKKAANDDGSLSITHSADETLDETAEAVNDQRTAEAAETAEDALASQLETVTPAVAAAAPSVADLQKDIAAATSEVETAAATPAPLAATVAEAPMPDYEPTLGGTLNATSEQAAEDKRREYLSDQNKTILSHDNGSPEPTHNTGPVFTPPPFSAATNDSSAPEQYVDPSLAPEPESAPTAPASPLTPPTFETLDDIDRKNRGMPHDDARSAVEAAFNSQPFDPANNPVSAVGAQPLGGDIAHDAQPVIEPLAPPDSGALPPLPDFTALPPPPPPSIDPAATPQTGQLGQIFGDAPVVSTPEQSNDPNQFRIPGQS